MIKTAIAPIQAWLMSQGRCVGCGRDLAVGRRGKHREGEKVTCSCGRIFVQNSKTKRYRRALIEEV